MGRSVELRDVPEPLARTQMYQLDLKDAIQDAAVTTTSFVDCDAPPPVFNSCMAPLPGLNKAYLDAFNAAVNWSKQANLQIQPALQKERPVRDQAAEIDNQIAALTEDGKRKNKNRIRELKKERKAVSKSLKKLVKNTQKVCRNIGKSTSTEVKQITRNLGNAYKSTTKAMKSRSPIQSSVEWQPSLACSGSSKPELVGCAAQLSSLNSAYSRAYEDLNRWSLRSAKQISNIQSQAQALNQELTQTSDEVATLTRADKRGNRKEIRNLKKEIKNLKKKIKQGAKRHKNLCGDLTDTLSEKISEYGTSTKETLSSAIGAMR